MSNYIRLLFPREAQFDRCTLEMVLQTVPLGINIRDDQILFHGKILAIVEFNSRGDGVMEDDIRLLCQSAVSSRDRRLEAAILDAVFMMTISPVVDGTEEILQPLFNALKNSFHCLIAYEGGMFEDSIGEIR